MEALYYSVFVCTREKGKETLLGIVGKEGVAPTLHGDWMTQSSAREPRSSILPSSRSELPESPRVPQAVGHVWSHQNEEATAVRKATKLKEEEKQEQKTFFAAMGFPIKVPYNYWKKEEEKGRQKSVKVFLCCLGL